MLNQPDTAHQPSLAFLPYLVTGDPYYLDELYFWISFNFLALPPGMRANAQGLFKDDQVRAIAWSMRTLAQAAWIAPDADAEEKAYLDAKLANNLNWFAANAVNANPFGFFGELYGRARGRTAAA